MRHDGQTDRYKRPHTSSHARSLLLGSSGGVNEKYNNVFKMKLTTNCERRVRAIIKFAITLLHFVILQIWRREYEIFQLTLRLKWLVLLLPSYKYIVVAQSV
jgi:hypothetical protein